MVNYQETIISMRPDRELRKKIVTPGDYAIVPYEDARCRIKITELTCKNDSGDCEIEKESRIFRPPFEGNVLIGDNDCFIDRDFELILQQMCSGEICEATMVYRDGEDRLMKEIKCMIELQEVMEEQLISDWSMDRLYETALHHKERGVELVREKRIADAFRRFSKALKMLVAIEPVDSDAVSLERVNEMVGVKAKVYNNLAYCQLHFNEYEAALTLCNRSLSYDTDNVKALYRRCLANSGLKLYEAAWSDIQTVLRLDPNDRTAQSKANELRPKVEKYLKDYRDVMKKMFG